MATNEVLADPIRLHLVSLLDVEQWCRFAFLCETTGISHDRLKRHFYLLRSQDYALTARSKDGAGWALLTPYGQEQRENYFVNLTELLSQARREAANAQAAQPGWFMGVGQL